jgi:hypothetical protein
MMFGYDREALYLRLDFENEIKPAELPAAIRVEVYTGTRYSLTLIADKYTFSVADTEQVDAQTQGIRARCDQIWEIAIPKGSLRFTPERIVYLATRVLDGDKEIEKFPLSGYISFKLPNPGETLFWEV